MLQVDLWVSKSLVWHIGILFEAYESLMDNLCKNSVLDSSYLSIFSILLSGYKCLHKNKHKCNVTSTEVGYL